MSATVDGAICATHSEMLGKWCWATFSAGDFELTMEHQNIHFSGRLSGQGADVNLDLIPKAGGPLESMGDVAIRISLNAEQLVLERRGNDCEWRFVALACRTRRSAKKLYLTCCASKVLPGRYRAGLVRFRPHSRSASGAAAVEGAAVRSSSASDPSPAANRFFSIATLDLRASAVSDPGARSPSVRQSCDEVRGNGSRLSFGRGLSLTRARQSSARQSRFPSQRSADTETRVLPTIKSPFSLVHDCPVPDFN